MTPVDFRQIRFFDSTVLKNTSSREPIGGIRRPKTDPKGQKDLEEPKVLPLMFFFCNYPFWPPGVDSLQRRLVVILPSRKIANTRNEILSYSALCAPERVRVMLAGVMMYLAIFRVVDKFGTRSDFFPSRRISRETQLFHKAWKRRCMYLSEKRLHFSQDVISQADNLETDGPGGETNVHSALQKMIDVIKTQIQLEFHPAVAPEDSVPPWARQQLVNEVSIVDQQAHMRYLCSLANGVNTFFEDYTSNYAEGGAAGISLLVQKGTTRPMGAMIEGRPYGCVRNEGSGMCLFRSLTQAVCLSLRDSSEGAEHLRDAVVQKILTELGLGVAVEDLLCAELAVSPDNRTWDACLGATAQTSKWLALTRETYDDSITPSEVIRRLHGVLQGEWPTFPLFLQAIKETANVNIVTIVVSSSGRDVLSVEQTAALEDVPTVYLMNHYGRHFEWLAPSENWKMLVDAAVRATNQGIDIRDPTSEEVVAILLSSSKANASNICDISTTRSAKPTIDVPSLSPDTTLQEAHESLVEYFRRGQLTREQGPASCVGTEMSRASSRYSVAAERAKKERDDVVLRVFRAPGVLTNDSSALSTTIWQMVHKQLIRADYATFSCRESLGRCLATRLPSGQSLRIKRKRGDGARLSYWNVNLRALELALQASLRCRSEAVYFIRIHISCPEGYNPQSHFIHSNKCFAPQNNE